MTGEVNYTSSGTTEMYNNISVNVIEPEREIFTREQIDNVYDLNIAIVWFLAIVVFYFKVLKN